MKDYQKTLILEDFTGLILSSFEKKKQNFKFCHNTIKNRVSKAPVVLSRRNLSERMTCIERESV